MTKHIFKAAVIGCGNIGAAIKRYGKNVQPATHAGAYQHNRRTRLVALVDVDKEKLAEAGRNFSGTRTYVDIKSMFRNERPDIVSIATPPQMHYKNVLEATKYKTPVVVCEKPIALSVTEAQRMIQRCKQSGSRLIINHTRRFDPLLSKWARRLRKGFLGNIFQANAYYYNGIMNNGTHLVDFLTMYFGVPKAVCGWYNDITKGNPGDPNIDGFIFFESGVRATIQSLSKNYGHFAFTFIGEKGILEIVKAGFKVFYRKKIPNNEFKGFFQLSETVFEEGDVRSYFASMVKHVVNVLDGKERPWSRGEDGLIALKILLALRKSADNNGKIVKV